MNGIEIIKKHLKDNGYAGLYDSGNGCICWLNDLVPDPECCDLSECEPWKDKEDKP